MLLFLVDLINIEIFRISFSFFYSFSFILRSRATSVWYQSVTSIRPQVIFLCDLRFFNSESNLLTGPKFPLFSTFRIPQIRIPEKKSKEKKRKEKTWLLHNNKTSFSTNQFQVFSLIQPPWGTISTAGENQNRIPFKTVSEPSPTKLVQKSFRRLQTLGFL